MGKLRIYAPARTAGAPGDYRYEQEALDGLDATIVECPASEDRFIEAAQDGDAVYVRGVTLTRRMIMALTKCRLIALGSVGVDYVDLDAATEKGIPVTNCPDTFIEEVADHAMMLLLAAHRRALQQDRMVREGRWTDGRRELLVIPRLMGQTLGLIAFGRVARAVLARARPFGLRVVAFDPFVDEQTISATGAEPVCLADLLRDSDFISVHLPATPHTRHFITERHFRQMKPTAILVNTSRGSCLDETA